MLGLASKSIHLNLGGQVVTCIVVLSADVIITIFFFAYSEFLSDFFTDGPNSVGVRSLDFKFIRERIKIKKIRPKFHFFF